MSRRNLARKIKMAYRELEKDPVFKTYNVFWNSDLETAEITVENDAGFRSIIIGNVNGMTKSRGYMYLFFTNDDSVHFPTITEIDKRLKTVLNQEILNQEDAEYFNWEQYGFLQLQREYFSEIIRSAMKTA